jgi:hypothetical protein
MDFIVKLLETKKGFNIITIIVYQLTKRYILKPIAEGEDSISAKEIVKLIYLSIRY